MPILATVPLVVENKIYPYYAVHMSLSPIWQPDNIAGSVALRLVPYREKTQEEGGGYEYLQEHSKSVVYFDVFKEMPNDIALADAVNGILGSIAKYVSDKQL
jgi:hypothetical protein